MTPNQGLYWPSIAVAILLEAVYQKANSQGLPAVPRKEFFVVTAQLLAAGYVDWRLQQ